MGAGQRLQRASTHGPLHAGGRAPSGLAPLSPAGSAAAGSGMEGLSPSSAAAAAMASKKTRRRWLEEEGDSLGGGDDFIPVGRQDQVVANTGHIVRMRRGEAWSKFLAYEGCCQVGRGREQQQGFCSLMLLALFLQPSIVPLSYCLSSSTAAANSSTAAV